MLTLGRRRRRGNGADDVRVRALRRIDGEIERLYALVADRLEVAADAFLTGERQTAADMVASDPEIDRHRFEVERLVRDELGRRAQLTDEEFTHLLLVLLVAPELERSADLVEHIALRTGHGLERYLSPLASELIGEMARCGATMWRSAGQAFVAADGLAGERLRSVDDELDDLHVRLVAELAAAALPPSAAIELGLVARFLERLGDHAVNVTRRLSPSVDGVAGAAPRPAG